MVEALKTARPVTVDDCDADARARPTSSLRRCDRRSGRSASRLNASTQQTTKRLVDSQREQDFVPRESGGKAFPSEGPPGPKQALTRTDGNSVVHVPDAAHNWGSIDAAEMKRVFNMGIGRVMVVSPHFADSIRQQLADLGVDNWAISVVHAASPADERVVLA